MQGLREVCEKLNLSALNLTSSRPAIAKDNILLVEGMHDLFVPKEDVENLWQSWGQPDIWRLPQGHISWMFTPGIDSRVLRWLSPRLNGDALRTLNK